MSHPGAGRHQWGGWAALVIGIAAVAARYVFGQGGGDATVGVAIAAAGLAGSIIVVATGRHEFKVDGANDLGPPSMQAGVLFSAMPNDWQLVLDAADPKARKRGGFEVKVLAAGDWLVIDTSNGVGKDFTGTTGI